MQKIDGKSINIIVPTELLAEIDRISKRQKQTRSETMRIFLQASSEIYTDFERIGAVKLHEVLERAQKTIKRSIGQQRLPTT